MGRGARGSYGIASEDNPVLLANRKAKALSSLLKAQPAAKRERLPWLDALFFLSADDVQCDLTGTARNRVLLKDRPADAHHPERKGILAALINREAPGIDPNCRDYIDIRVAKAIARAKEQAGIRPSQRSRRVGDYILGDLIADGPGYQDRLAKHASLQDGNVCCRVRQYTVALVSTEEQRNHLKRAAAREFQIIQRLDHQGILPVLDYKEHENGPALLFRYLDPDAMRFDHYLASSCQKLTTGQRLEMLRQIADAIRYAHRKRVIHRSLSPQSILVSDAAAPTPRLQVFNWQVGIREAASTSDRVTNVEDLVEALALVYMSPEALSDSRKVTEASDVFSLVVNLICYSVVEAWAWLRSVEELVTRPVWDGEARRPSQADKRRALQREDLREEIRVAVGERSMAGVSTLRYPPARSGCWSVRSSRKVQIETYIAEKTIKAVSSEPGMFTVSDPPRRRQGHIKLKKGGIGEQFSKERAEADQKRKTP